MRLRGLALRVGARRPLLRLPRSADTEIAMRPGLLLALPALLALLILTGCASTGSVSRPATAPESPVPAAPGGMSGPSSEVRRGRVDGEKVAETALALRGLPYRAGGADLSGFDCSGLIQYVFLQHGVWMPKTVREQFQFGSRVKASKLAAGDLVFFTTTRRGASHVGIAIGGGKFVHAPTSRGVVRIERISSSYWKPRLVGARRIRDVYKTAD